MGRRVWLLVLCLYAAIGIADGASRLAALRRITGRPADPAAIAVAFCAGLFWPVDIPARLLLGPR